MADYEDFSDAPWYGKHILAVVLADGVTSIGNHAFFDCKELVLVTIPDSVISIGAGAFAGCKSLTTFFVSAGNPAYGLLDGVLFDKAQTTLVAYPGGRQGSSYAIPDGVTSIGDYAFCRCESLTSVHVPDSVTSIGWWAFAQCSGLTEIRVKAVVPPVMGMEPFYDVDKSIPVYVPAESIEAYQNSKWGEFFSNIQPM